MNTNWVKLEEFNSYYKIKNGSLISLPFLADEIQNEINFLRENYTTIAYLEKSDQDNKLLEKINALFKTSFSYEDFGLKPCLFDIQKLMDFNKSMETLNKSEREYLQ